MIVAGEVEIPLSHEQRVPFIAIAAHELLAKFLRKLAVGFSLVVPVGQRELVVLRVQPENSFEVIGVTTVPWEKVCRLLPIVWTLVPVPLLEDSIQFCCFRLVD